MMSKSMARLIKMLPEKLVVKIARNKINGYLKKYAKINVSGYENIKKANGAKIFICNNLSNSDGFIIEKVLKDDYDPTFVAGVKLSNDPVTNLGTKIVKNISIKPNSADKDAIMSMIKVLKGGENLVIFPEGTRSRTGSMIEAKKGILLVARMSKATIVPISMYGTEKLLPINKDGDMAGEQWNEAEVNVKIGEPIHIPKKDKEESKHEYDDRCLNYIMKSIAIGLPEEYRGVYS